MDGVGISIIERPRPLPGHDTPNPTEHPYTLKCEEPGNLATIPESQADGAATTSYRERYEDAAITKKDIFFYVYALLHHPEYRERFRIGERKMRFPKLGRRDKDFTRLEYNDYVTLTGIPAQAQGYSISGRSPLEWIIDRYHVKTDKASGIVNDPNDFLREQGRPNAVVDLIKRLVTVSMRTQELLETLPKLEIPEVQN